jgi:carboxyl-terminal processing protease
VNGDKSQNRAVASRDSLEGELEWRSDCKVKPTEMSGQSRFSFQRDLFGCRRVGNDLIGVLTPLLTGGAMLVAATFMAQAQARPPHAKAGDLQSFELVWKTLEDRYWDSAMGGLDWNAIHARYRAKVEQCETTQSVRALTEDMIQLLPSSHLAIIPASLYKTNKLEIQGAPAKEPASGSFSDDEDSDTGCTGIKVAVLGTKIVVMEVAPGSPAANGAVRAGWTLEAVDGMRTEQLFSRFGATERQMQLIGRVANDWLVGSPGSKVALLFRTPQGQTVKRLLTRETEPGEKIQFGNLPPEHVHVEHRMLAGDVGYIRLNLFLDPIRVMPEIEKAIAEFRRCPGIVLDIRDNPGGIGIMAMGIAGWFISDEGKQLGTMTTRDSTFNFVVNPRLEPYEGRLVILVNENSASTSEILAQGMKDLNRAKVFGMRTAGAALPSTIITLPNDDRFQYPEANYRSVNGRVLEGNGVEPDVGVEPTIEALSAGRDLPLQAAKSWCLKK